MNILAATDLSDSSPAVIEEARKLATATGGELWLLHVGAPDPDFVGYDVGPQHVRDAVAGELRDEHRQLHEIADELRAAGLGATALCIQGRAPDTILTEAERLGVGLIVLGSHGHGRVSHLLTGSVSEAVLRQSTLPVLIVPTRSE